MRLLHIAVAVFVTSVIAVRQGPITRGSGSAMPTTTAKTSPTSASSKTTIISQTTSEESSAAPTTTTVSSCEEFNTQMSALQAQKAIDMRNLNSPRGYTKANQMAVNNDNIAIARLAQNMPRGC
ncbi:hypothetical protein V499_05980 [Pseudogymnoascus sp. VKM F-103]|uniref:SCP domain-containing protein n=1 Tax=Pseudogymnoascus verrucosus TaxID=342668 RepID=A0A1B8GBT5_9PEZI|nr:uncharacterized protein VE01_08449 [Pseudogymnoascus verrucosus]KFY73968.1 hypothetical protein V499_05980 [Pseudogymnoascus sp. VKM F-103]OBT93294.1 hypothetical protein VE01_08449 [Pseudogymnoascus verrucosus]